MKKKTTKLKGSSLVEVLVSLIIIMVVISLALGIFIKVSRVSPLLSIKLTKEMEEIAMNSILEKDFEEREFILSDGTAAIQRIESYEESTLFYVYELKTDTKERSKMYSFRKLLLKPYD